MELTKLRKIYFIGIGGIGMSALARYFNAKGTEVFGYDKTSTLLTKEMEKEGIFIHYTDDVGSVISNPDLVVYTPAIPTDLEEWKHVLRMGYPLMKRSEVLGLISKDYFCIAVAGTHGKTSITSMIAHIINSAGIEIIAFMGGISKNYNSNLIMKANSKVFVVEADEFDKSFLTLNPDIAIVSSIDADHLDIYKTHDHLKDTFSQFIDNVKQGGKIFARKSAFPDEPKRENLFTYSVNTASDIIAENIRVTEGKYMFDFRNTATEIKGLVLNIPGRHNVENAIAAISVALSLDVNPEIIRKAFESYKGVKRRFDCQINRPEIVYIDDYAHHPEEIRALISAVKELYPSKKITGIFQPHLFSRTRDFIDGFAESLSMLDCLILLEIYPARELPIEGIDSKLLLNKVHVDLKILTTKENVLAVLDKCKPEVLLTIGAGDIDQLVEPIVNHYNNLYK
ncbi:MAG: UDP-N-acetylmuramate--L-alanine ligase [Bacteroidota bacterium]